MMSPISNWELALSTLLAGWLTLGVPGLAWWCVGQEGVVATLLIAGLLYAATLLVVGLPMLLFGLLTPRR